MMIGVGLISTVSHTLYRPHWYLLAGMVAANRRITDNLLRARNEATSLEPVREDSDRLGIQRMRQRPSTQGLS
jgi:hypothetical protein